MIVADTMKGLVREQLIFSRVVVYRWYTGGIQVYTTCGFSKVDKDDKQLLFGWFDQFDLTSQRHSDTPMMGTPGSDHCPTRLGRGVIDYRPTYLVLTWTGRSQVDHLTYRDKYRDVQDHNRTDRTIQGPYRTIQ